MATGDYTLVKRRLYNAQIFVQSLLTVKLHFLINMVIGTAYEYARFLNSHLFYQFEVFFVGANPACYFGKIVAKLLTGAHGGFVLVAVKKELAGADKTFLAAQFVLQFK